jgi:hypothetical protein
MAYDPDAPVFANEPALTIGVVVAVLVTLGNVFGVAGLDADTVGTVVTDLVVLLGALGIRSKVTPV